MAWSSTQKYLAEFLGTFALLLFGGGSAVTSLTVPLVDPLARVILVSAAFGLTVLGAAYALGEISGGHFNPAVTASMALSRRMPLKDVVPYIVAQIIGGFLGIAVIGGIVYGNTGAWATAKAADFGSQCFAGNGAPGGCGFSLGSVFLIELAMTFVFVFIIQRVTRPDSGAGSLAPVAIGLTLMVTNLVAIPIDGASINPVRSLSPALLAAAAGGNSWAIDQAWLFWVAPILGGLLAAIVESMLRPTSNAS
jgi:aquaporin Z